MTKIKIYRIDCRIILRLEKPKNKKLIINNNIIDGNPGYYKLKINGEDVDLYYDLSSVQMSAENINLLLKALSKIKFSS